MLKAKIFSTTNVNALISTKKKKRKKKEKKKKKRKENKQFLANLVLKKDIILFLFVFVDKWLHLNVFRNNDFEYL